MSIGGFDIEGFQTFLKGDSTLIRERVEVLGLTSGKR